MQASSSSSKAQELELVTTGKLKLPKDPHAPVPSVSGLSHAAEREACLVARQQYILQVGQLRNQIVRMEIDIAKALEDLPRVFSDPRAQDMSDRVKAQKRARCAYLKASLPKYEKALADIDARLGLPEGKRIKLDESLDEVEEEDPGGVIGPKKRRVPQRLFDAFVWLAATRIQRARAHQERMQPKHTASHRQWTRELYSHVRMRVYIFFQKKDSFKKQGLLLPLKEKFIDDEEARCDHDIGTVKPPGKQPRRKRNEGYAVRRRRGGEAEA